MPPAIKVENLCKSYLVGHDSAQGEKYTALRDVVSRNARNLARKTRDMLTGKQIVQGDEVEEFWALKDINFEIQPGDRVGIIGRNGAGKSTLLKILSRITEPTHGRVTINGRVASLLEVGTGFHPELTGRENIFLNGAILGMSRKEIQRKFDEIVDFAEVEKFLDTPVKRYSSGMYVRLAFAVAAHLEPEILIVDEVLAVGDAQFQKKCLGKMNEIGKTGRTVLFVSHNLSAIEALCSFCVYLKQGEIIDTGTTNIVVGHYVSDQTPSGDGHIESEVTLSKGLSLSRIEFSPDSVKSLGDICYRLIFIAESNVKLREIALLFYHGEVRVSIIDLRKSEGDIYHAKNGRIVIEGEISEIPFVEGVYDVGLYIVTDDACGNYLDLAKLIVTSRNNVLGGIIPYPSSSRGIVEMVYKVYEGSGENA